MAHRPRMRQGFLLIDVLLAVVITAMVAAFAIPRIAAWSDAAAARRESLQVVAAIDAARGAAMRLGATSVLDITDTSYRVTVVVDTDTVLAWRATGPALRAVTVSGVGAPIGFGPDGLATGAANRTLTLRIGSATQTVVISRLGRVTY